MAVCLFAGCNKATPTPDATNTPDATQVPEETKKPDETPEPTPFIPTEWDYEYEVVSEEDKTAILRTIIVPEGVNHQDVKELVFPSTIHGYTVISIGWDVLSKIHKGGFEDDCWVTKVTIPATVESFENDIFRVPKILDTVIFEDESKITYIMDRCFRGTKWEENRAYDNDGFCMVNNIVCAIYTDGDVVIPDGATMITGRPFEDTEYGPDVTSITIPSSVKIIGDKLMNDVNPDAVIKCEAGSEAEAYAKKNGFKYEIIGEVVEYDYEYRVVDEDAKTAILGTIILPEGTNNQEIKELVLPSTIHGYTVVGIGWDVFSKMHEGGFADDNWLNKVTIPGTVEFFENDVFRTAYGCTEIIFEDESKITRIDDLCFRNTPWEKDRAFDNDGICMVNGIVTGIYLGGDVVIPDGAKAISGRPFVNTDCGGDVTSITIPASVTSVSKLMNDVNENAVIKCTAGSAAEDYAKAKGLKYEIIG